MPTVEITGWRPGFRKIRFNRLLRDSLGMSLSEAKASVDLILENVPVSMAFPTIDEATDFLERAQALGAVGELGVDQTVGPDDARSA